jgi:hypothetical protein
MSLVPIFNFFWSDGVVRLFQISGIAIGLNLVFKYDDIVTGICFTSFAVNLLPYAISHLVNFKKQLHHIKGPSEVLMYICFLPMSILYFILCI